MQIEYLSTGKSHEFIERMPQKSCQNSTFNCHFCKNAVFKAFFMRLARYHRKTIVIKYDNDYNEDYNTNFMKISEINDFKQDV